MTDEGKSIKRPAGPSLKGLKFLVVEDDEHMRNLIVKVLTEIGVLGIAEADDGSGALAVMRDFQPDIVISDWKMEPVDGIEFVRRLRAGESGINRFTAVIMLTVHTERMRIVEARDAGVNEFVAKPVSVRTLYARIRALIEEPRHFVRTDHYFGPDRRRKQAPFTGANRRLAQPWLVKVEAPGSGAPPPVMPPTPKR
ncbi:MAG TPA: response regulator [Magnetospirillaceae bacterium]|jgi:DNA-binding response OmpR family regulator